jgi:hypothetical protein
MQGQSQGGTPSKEAGEGQPRLNRKPLTRDALFGFGLDMSQSK